MALTAPIATAQLIQTIAGNGGTGYSGDGGPASASTLNNPYAVAVDAQGNVYIADSDNCRIRVINNGASPVTIAGISIAPDNIATVAGNGTCGFYGDGGQATSAEIYNPSGVAVDGSGNIYIDDLYNYRIRKVDTTGVITTVTGNGNSFYSGNGPAADASLFPYTVAVDSAGNLYIADTYNNAIRVINMGSTSLTLAGVTIPPGNIATVAGNGDTGSGGDNGPALQAQFNDPYGVAVDSNQNIYICDTYNRKIRVVNTGTLPITIATVTIQPGNVATVAGDGTYWFKFAGPALNAEFADPDAVAVDRLGNIYISDTENDSIQLVDHRTSLIVTIAGNTFNYGYNGDNIPAAGAWLSYPRTIAVDGNGDVFIPDQPNERVREIVTNTLAQAFSNASSTTFVEAQPGSFAITTNYWPTPSLSVSGLPSGISFTDNGDGTGLLAGTPAGGTHGTYQLTFTANDGFFPAVVQTFTLTILSPGGGPTTSSVTFLGIDIATQGNWQGVYGGDGYVLAGDTDQFIPSYASFTVNNPVGYMCSPTPHTYGNVCIWFSPTVTGLYSEEPVTDPRALLLPGSTTTRILATWENNPSYSFDLNFTDGQPHLFALYALDWDDVGRSEVIQIQDAATGFPLYSLPIDDFILGSYLVWNITGHVTITVTVVNGMSASTNAAFFGGSASSSPTISQQPQNATVSLGSTATFSVVALGNNLTYQWWSQPPGASSFSQIGGAVSNTYTTPAVSLPDGGTQFKCVVTNSLGSVTSNIVTLSLLAPASIAVTPSNPTILPEGTQSLVATATYPGGGTQNISSQVTWSSLSTGVATVSSSGVVTAVGTGSATIDATLLGVTGSTVVSVPALSSITVTPANQTVSTGGTLQFAATGTYQGGGTQSITSQVAWSSSNTSFATISSSGLATAVSGGTTTISAVQGSVTGTTTLTVQASGGTQCPCTIWSSSTVPSTIDGGPDSPVELGVAFQATTSGTISGVRFYKASTNTGTHVGNLWSSTGTLLASATFTNETSSGWQQVSFSSPVTITAGTTYIASYHTMVGHWSVNRSYFASTGVSNPPLQAPQSGSSQGNGVYAYGSTSLFPSNSYVASNYWVDVVFNQAAALTSIGVTPTSPTLLPGATQQMTATGTYQGDSTQNITSSATWTSSNTSVATVSSTGIVTAVGAGSSTITATLSGISGTTTVTVPALSSIAVTPANPSVLPGGTQQFTATGTYVGGGTLNITSQVTWSSLSTSVATINSSGGLATAVNSGSSTISATQGSVTGTTTLTVPALPSIVVTPSAPTINAGATQQFTATGTYQGGGTQNITSQVTWSSSNTAFATINSSGLATALSGGTTTISAVQGSITGSTTLTVQAFGGTQCPCTIWSSTTTPGTPDNGADNPVELGVAFQATTSGTISGVRFYKASTNTGTHVGNLWSSTGTLLASATFTNETSSGWQQVSF
ncbi:MAG: DUF4082 domain-containing protein, partial [Candidatus Acidiferrales bacterium]